MIKEKIIKSVVAIGIIGFLCVQASASGEAYIEKECATSGDAITTESISEDVSKIVTTENPTTELTTTEAVTEEVVTTTEAPTTIKKRKGMSWKYKYMYAQTTVVCDVDTESGLVTCQDFNGNLWQFYEDEDGDEYLIGDIVSMIMDDNGTDEIYDDIILSAKYDGWLDTDDNNDIHFGKNVTDYNETEDLIIHVPSEIEEED